MIPFNNQSLICKLISYDFFGAFVQPGPDSIGIVAISHGCPGVAARACGLVGLDPTRVSPLLVAKFPDLVKNSTSHPKI